MLLGNGVGQMLRITNLSRRFGSATAVDDVSLTIQSGQMVGIIGRSGAGKSTLLRMVNRLQEPSAGRIVCDGTDVTALRGKPLRDWRASCAMIFQQFNLLPRLDTLTNVLVGRLSHRQALASLLGLFTDAERATALVALERFDLAHTAMQRAGTLSGGQQQRVAICRALMQEPRIMLADEPIASLDPGSARVVMDALHRINREDGLTVLVNLHHLETARAYCDRIIGLARGAVVFDGSPDQLTSACLADIYGHSNPDAGEARTRPLAAADAFEFSPKKTGTLS